MADKFGAAHRELVKDTNAGRTAPPERRAITTSVQKGGSQTTVIGSNNKSEIHQGLLALGQTVLQKVGNRIEEQDFNEGYSKGLEEGFIENEQSPIRDMLFGKSATLRGAQKRFVENDSTTFLNSEMTDMENTMKGMDEKDYRAYLSEKIMASAEDHKDPEFKAQIMASATKHMEQLARVHSKARQAWVDQENEQAVSDSMATAILTMRNAQSYGDTKSQRDAQTAAENIFTKPEDMHEDVFHDSVTRNLVKSLTSGDDLAYRLTESSGLLSALSPTEQLKVQQAKGIYERKNGRNFQRDQSSLLARIEKGQAEEEEVRNFVAKYPDSGVTVNKMLDIQDKYNAERDELAKSQAEADDLLISGDVKWNDKTSAEQRQSVTNVFNQMADAGIKAGRQSEIDKGTFDGDPSAAPTAKERMDYMLDNPYQFASTAAQHPETKYPMVQNMATSMMSDLRNEQLDEDGVAGLTKKMEFMEQFKRTMGNNFSKQFRSEEDAANYAVYSGLINEAGFEPINVIRDLRRIAAAPDIDVKDFSESIEDSIDDVADSFLDASPESQGLWGLYNKTPDNEQAFNDEIKMHLNKYTKAYKGDMEKATLATQAVMRNRGVVSNGQFIPNGALINIKGGSVEDYLRGLNSDDTFKANVVNMGLGFAVDADYTDMEITRDPFNKDNIILHSTSEVTGEPISVAVRTPKQGSDFKPYGLNSFTGFNPHIENKDERRKAMLRDNVLMKGYSTVNNAINKALDFSSQPEANELSTGTVDRGDTPAPSPVIESILKSEGGFQNQKSDKGNQNSKGEFVGTNFGISAKFLEKKLGRVPTTEDVKNITKAQAAEWHQESVDTEITALKKATNKSVSNEAELLLAHAVTLTSRRGMTKVFKNLPDNASTEQLAEAYLGYLKTLDSWKTYGKGWTNRVNELVAKSK